MKARVCLVVISILLSGCAAEAQRSLIRRGQIHQFEVTSVTPANSAWLTKVCKPASPQAVELSELLSDPKRFEGQTLSVTGYYGLAEDESAIYLSSNDYLHRKSRRGIWLLGSYEPELAGHRVVATGVVTTMDLWVGYPWPASLCGVWTIALAAPQ